VRQDNAPAINASAGRPGKSSGKYVPFERTGCAKDRLAKVFLHEEALLEVARRPESGG